MHEIHDGALWIGNTLDLHQPRKIFDAGISAVVDVAVEEPPAQLPRQLTYCRFPLNDGAGNDQAVMQQSIMTLAMLLDANTRTIIVCAAGLSRSPAIASFGLAIHLGQDPSDMLAQIAKVKPVEMKGTFWNEGLQAYLAIVKKRYPNT